MPAAKAIQPATAEASIGRAAQKGQSSVEARSKPGKHSAAGLVTQRQILYGPIDVEDYLLFRHLTPVLASHRPQGGGRSFPYLQVIIFEQLPQGLH